jgi:hypothetical protein
MEVGCREIFKGCRPPGGRGARLGGGGGARGRGSEGASGGFSERGLRIRVQGLEPDKHALADFDSDGDPLFPFPPGAADLCVPVRDGDAEDLPDSDAADEADRAAEATPILRTRLEDYEEIVGGR